MQLGDGAEVVGHVGGQGEDRLRVLEHVLLRRRGQGRGDHLAEALGEVGGHAGVALIERHHVGAQVLDPHARGDHRMARGPGGSCRSGATSASPACRAAWRSRPPRTRRRRTDGARTSRRPGPRARSRCPTAAPGSRRSAPCAQIGDFRLDQISAPSERTSATAQLGSSGSPGRKLNVNTFSSDLVSGTAGVSGSSAALRSARTLASDLPSVEPGAQVDLQSADGVDALAEGLSPHRHPARDHGGVGDQGHVGDARHRLHRGQVLHADARCR